MLDVKADIETGSRSLSENAAKHSQILNGLAKADTLLTNGARELVRHGYGDVIDLSAQAIKELNDALTLSGFSATASLFNVSDEFDRKNCRLGTSKRLALVQTQLQETIRSDRNDLDPGKRQSATLLDVLSPRRLRPLVVAALFNAYELQATGYFLLNEPAQVQIDGKWMLSLDGARWEGYHWMGVSAAQEDPEDKDRQAEACYRGSVSRRSEKNKDYIKLAELYLLKWE